MRIIKATEAIPVAHPIICIFGQPGICKTSLGYSAKDPLLMDFDDGAHRAANRRDTVLIKKWSDVDELTASDVLANYGSIVVDTVGRCLDLMTVDIIDNNPKYGRDGALTLQGYGVLKTRFRNWMTKLRTMGKDIVLIAHAKEDKDGDALIVRPDITGSSYGEVMKLSDLVGFVYMVGKNRILDFNPTDRWVGKNPGQWAALPVPPVAKASGCLAKVIDDARATLGAMSEESAKAVQLVDDWRAGIETYTTVDEFNKQLPIVLAIPSVIVLAQVKKLLWDRAKVLKFDFDAKANKFTVLEKVPA